MFLFVDVQFPEKKSKEHQHDGYLHILPLPKTNNVVVMVMMIASVGQCQIQPILQEIKVYYREVRLQLPKILHLLIRMAKMDRFDIVKDDVHIYDIDPYRIEKCSHVVVVMVIVVVVVVVMVVVVVVLNLTDILNKPNYVLHVGEYTFDESFPRFLLNIRQWLVVLLVITKHLHP
jgi:hypothetical protein